MEVTCKNCHEEFEAKRKTARFCSDLCRVTFNRKKVHGPGEPFVIVAAKKSKEQPPPGLKGIDLAIWKAEQKAKQKA